MELSSIATARVNAGHVIFEINHITKEMVLADMVETNGCSIKYVKKDGCEYVAALNKKNAIKKFNKGK